MHRKVLSIVGIFLLFIVFHSCSSSPEKGLLERYFHALSLNDLTTMSTMAVEPVALDVESWEILNVGEEVTETAKLYELNQEELRLKKELEDHVAPTVAADDALYMIKNYPNIRVVPVTEDVATLAAKLRVKYYKKPERTVSYADMINLATAILTGCKKLYSGDNDFRGMEVIETEII